MTGRNILLIPGLVTLVLASACSDKNNLEQRARVLQADLKEQVAERKACQQNLKSTLEGMENERRRWMSENYNLNKTKMLLESELKNRPVRVTTAECLLRNKEMKEWANKMFKAIGPAIWIPSQYDWPMYEKKPDDISVKGVLAELNQWFASRKIPTLKQEKLEGSTITVGVSDDAQLTERMGSSGASSYIDAALYTLTSLDNIDCVDFDFVEGSHAAPGLRCRK